MRNKRWIGVTALAVITAAALCASIVIKRNLKEVDATVEVAMTENGAALNIEKAEELLDGKGDAIGHRITVRGNGFNVKGFVLAVDLSKDKTTIQGIQVVEQTETPNLGAKIADAAFLDQFTGLTGTVAMADVSGDNAVDAISGATITSKAFAEAVNNVFSYVSGESASAGNSSTTGVSKMEATADGGCVVTVGVKGFGTEPLVLEVTMDAAKENVTGLKVVSQNETPGFGANVETEEFLSQFKSLALPVSLGEGSVDAISGATVTSTAVVSAINEAFEYATGDHKEDGAVSEDTVTTETLPKMETTADGGYVVTIEAKGFGVDPMVLEVAIDAAKENVTSLKVISQNETPGLGGNVETEDFLSQFQGLLLPASVGEDSVNVISGATVTTTAVVTAINEALEFVVANAK